MRKLLNLTQHKASAEQVEAGVFDLNEKHTTELRQLLTFEELPAKEEIGRRATAIAELALMVKSETYPGGDEFQGEWIRCMIGGAPYLMGTLERRLKEDLFTPVYAFSQRVSEEKEVDGEVIKTQAFKHLGFVEVGK